MAKQSIDQVYFNYVELEEYQAGMWERMKGENFNESRAKARNMMMDIGRFSEAMSKVCDDWPKSCQQNFTDGSINPVAWLGQAAVCLELGVAEAYTRSAWMDLPEDIRIKACAAAKSRIEDWRADYIGQGGLFDV